MRAGDAGTLVEIHSGAEGTRKPRITTTAPLDLACSGDAPFISRAREWAGQRRRQGAGSAGAGRAAGA